MNNPADYEELINKLVVWIKQEVRVAGAKGLVFGLSGGIDSAVTGIICKRAFPRNVLGLLLPCCSYPEDQSHASMLVDKFDISTKVVVLDGLFDQLKELLDSRDSEHIQDQEISPSSQKTALANIKPRLRMIVLYYYANQLGYLVAGSGNKSELSVGYFTKYGDGGVDLLPLGNLTKTQVRELANYLGVPKEILHKAPSAGLWEGQTDEKEMGLTYEELDRYILTGEAEPGIKEKIEQMIEGSKHKGEMPPIPPF